MAKLAKFTLPQYGSFTTDAAMQAFFTEYTTFFEDNGFVRTSDTGQFDPATAAGTGTFYEVRKFTGTHATSSPIFVRLTFSTRGAGASVTVGTGSDGAGNITGAWLTSSLGGSTITSSSNGGLLLAAVPGEYVTFSQFNYASGAFDRGLAFTIGRSVNANTGDITGTQAYAFVRRINGTSPNAWVGARDNDTGNTYSSTTLSTAYFDWGATASPKPLEVILLRRIWFDLGSPRAFPHAVAAFSSEWPLGSQTTLANVGPNNMTFRVIAPDLLGRFE